MSEVEPTANFPEYDDEPSVVIPDVVRESNKEDDRIMLLTAAGIGAALLTGYAIRRKLKKRKNQ